MRRLLIMQTNAFLQHAAPWDLYRNGNQAEGETVIYLCAEVLRVCGILLQPFMPTTMALMLDMLVVAPHKRGLEHAVLGADFEYGSEQSPGGFKRKTDGKTEVLFPPLQCYG